MDAGFEAHLRVGECSFDRSDAALLRAVDEHASLNAAADALGRSYSRAHDRITTLEAAVGPLLERERGGPGGGGSELTPTARDLLARFARLEAALADTARVDAVALEGRVTGRDGELATVGTPAGTVRALLFEAAERVQVSFRADAVTLQDPEFAPAADATSARNRFPGTVVAVDPGESIARVDVEVGAPEPLSALITDESRRRLDIEAGREVVASVKATAVRATPRPG
ncbi:MAG: TOBE domain-containing protein [Halobacteriales archaeon]